MSYHISIGFSARLHKKKNTPWPILTLRILLYEIWNLKHAEAEMEEFNIVTFGTRSFNPYDPHCLVKNHCARVKLPWIHGVCHWTEEDPWIYCYHFFRLNESVEIAIEWLEKRREAVAHRAPSSATAEGSIPTHDKGKRKVVDNAEAEQSCKIKADPLVMKAALEIDANR